MEQTFEALKISIKMAELNDYLDKIINEGGIRLNEIAHNERYDVGFLAIEASSVGKTIRECFCLKNIIDLIGKAADYDISVEELYMDCLEIIQ